MITRAERLLAYGYAANSRVSTLTVYPTINTINGSCPMMASACGNKATERSCVLITART